MRPEPASEAAIDGLPERYEIIRHLADGGMGSVWCAHDAVLGRQVAVKLLATRFAADSTAVRRFNREARAAARLSAHPHVVTIFDVGEAAAQPFLVMELMGGGTVAEAMRRAPIAREQALRWLGQAASALDFAHRQGVVHRDIKPHNFLLDEGQTLHIADFGIAHLATEEMLTGTHEVMGTASYLAPEQATGGPGNAASDRYSLAVVAFELLTGRKPFIADHPAAQARAHLEDDPPAASSIEPALPRALDAVLARGLAKAPDSRWPTGESFVGALESALSGGEVDTAEHTMPLAAEEPEATTAEPILSSPSRRRHPAPPRASAAPRPSGIPAARAASARTGGPPRPARRGSRRGVVAALLVAGLALAAVLALAGGGPASSSRSVAAKRPPAAPARRRTTASRPAATPARTTSPTTSAPAPASTPVASSGDPAALQAQGHALMLQGQYDQAIALLRRAVDAATPGSLTQAYALYDLGHSLRVSGHPQEAIPILQRRLQIPNQTGVVNRELQLALQQAGRGGGGNQSGQAPPGQNGNGGD